MPRLPARALPLTLALTVLLLPMTAACGSGSDSGADSGKDEPRSAEKSGAAAPPAAPAKVEVIADLAGCEAAEIRIEADELREGVCESSVGGLVITTFPEEKFKTTWLESASIYGGQYLVGPRWAIGAEPAALKKLRPKVGGTIRKLRGTQPQPSQ